MESKMTTKDAINKYIFEINLFSETLNALWYQKLTEGQLSEEVRLQEEKYVLDCTSHFNFINYIDKVWKRIENEPDCEFVGFKDEIKTSLKFLCEDLESLPRLPIDNKEMFAKILVKNIERLKQLYKQACNQ